MMGALLLLALLAPLQAEAVAAADVPAPTLAERVARQPAAVRAFIDRRTGCNHWAGEEPYDAARRREIERALVDLRCTRLDADEAALLRRFGADAELRALLHAVRDEPGGLDQAVMNMTHRGLVKPARRLSEALSRSVADRAGRY